ncbi:hypothetical protein [Peribacillus sp. NPDC096540]|uniref:hypothetical protein n=1 Tax=Peribacillus sp. NPDC096540 TaxID=3390612 RepID=UPI003CFD2471
MKKVKKFIHSIIFIKIECNNLPKNIGRFIYERKISINLDFTGALALSIGFAKDLQKTEVSAEVYSKQTDTYKHVTREEQERREGMLAEGKDVYTVITAEEQEMVENMSAQQGFVPQENGTGFFLKKEK